MIRACIRPFKSDYEALRKLAESDANISLNGLIRAILRSYVRNMTSVENTKLDGTETITLDDSILNEIITQEKTETPDSSAIAVEL